MKAIPPEKIEAIKNFHGLLSKSNILRIKSVYNIDGHIEENDFPITKNDWQINLENIEKPNDDADIITVNVENDYFYHNISIKHEDIENFNVNQDGFFTYQFNGILEVLIPMTLSVTKL